MTNVEESRKLEKGLLVAIAFIFLLYQLVYTQIILWDPQIHRIIHLGSAFTMVLLAIALRRQHLLMRLLVYIMLMIAIATAIELVYIYPQTLGSFVLPPTGAMVGGTISLVLSFILTWWRFGPVFSVFFLFALIYGLFGAYFLPEAIQPPPVTVLRLLAWVAGDLISEGGLYGEILSLLANYVWLFMVYGAFLQAFGGLRFIRGLGTLFSARLASGAAMLSVVTSSLVGMVTGSTAANITITGSFTIPMMKKAGYRNEQAGAIELASSNGGQIMPPIMGVAAFLLADYIGIPYVRVIIYAALPALFYYICLGLYVQLQAKKANFARMDAKVNHYELLVDAPLFLIPFLVLVYFLMRGYSLPFVGFWSILSIIVTGVISHLLRKEKGAKISWRQAKNDLVAGVISASDVSITAALLGAITAVIEMSGLGFRMGGFLVSVFHGNLFLLLLAAAILCLILGTGLPSVAAYMITAAILAAPITQLGVPPIAIHLFIFVYSVFAHLTPPIGAGLLIASRLSGGGYWSTAKEALIGTFIIFILPFFFVYAPATILQLEGLTPLDIVLQLVVTLVLLISLSLLFNNWGFRGRLGHADRGLYALGAIASILFIVFPAYGLWLAILAVVVLLLGLVSNARRARKAGPVSVRPQT